MRDGQTRRIASTGDALQFLETHRASLTVLKGPAAGSEFALDRARHRIGRTADADLQLDEPSVSSEHAAIELGACGFGIRDLGSTNGVLVNGASVDACELEHGDRIAVGGCELQYVVEPREGGRVWQLDDLDGTLDDEALCGLDASETRD